MSKPQGLSGDACSWRANGSLPVRLGLRVLTVSFRSALLTVVAGAVVLGSMWSAKRWLGWVPQEPFASLLVEMKQQAEPLLYVYDNQTGWKANPYTQLYTVRKGPFQAGEPRDFRLRTNSEGFFDREHRLTTPYYRVAFLGDSWVEAQQVAASNRFTDLVEGYVFAQSKGSKAVETMNFGLSNLGTAQEYGILKQYVLKYRPNEIWILFNPRDDISDSSALFTQPPLGPTYRYTKVKGSIVEVDIEFGFPDPPAVAAELQKKRYGRWLNLTPDQVLPYFYAEEKSPVFEAAWEDCRQSLRAIRRLADGIGAKVVLVYLPQQFEVDKEEWQKYVAVNSSQSARQMLHFNSGLGEQRLRELATAEGVKFFSLKPLILEKGRSEIFQDHFSRMGHHWVADTIARNLADEGCCKLPTLVATELQCAD